MTESEFWAWSQNNDNRVWTFRVSDRFGDAGLIGIVGLQQKGTTATMVDFVLSCRVMGRRIEETMVHVAAHKAKQLGLNCLCATYRPTPRNQPCVEFLEKRSAFRRQNADEPYSLSLDNPPPLPDCIKLIDGSK
jgi:FkbH-like protein